MADIKHRGFNVLRQKLSWIFACSEIEWKRLFSNFVCNFVTFACKAKRWVTYCPKCSQSTKMLHPLINSTARINRSLWFYACR